MQKDCIECSHLVDHQLKRKNGYIDPTVFLHWMCIRMDKMYFHVSNVDLLTLMIIVSVVSILTLAHVQHEYLIDIIGTTIRLCRGCVNIKQMRGEFTT